MRFSTSDLISKAGLSGSYGGISFVPQSPSDGIDAVHFLYDEVSKFSAALDLSSRYPQMSLQERAGPDAKRWTMRAPMLALQNPDPLLGMPRGIALQPTLFIRNTTAKNITADLSLTWRGDSGKGQVKLPQLQLAPFATQQLQIGSTLLQIPNKIPQNAHWGLLTLTTDALPDDLVAFATSIDSSGRYNLATRFAGGIGGHFTGGEWDLDANHNEIAAITNIGAKPTNALLTLHYDKGTKKYELQQTIAPGDQMWVNLAQLVRNRTVDRNDNTLPADVSSVTYEVKDLSPAGLGVMMDSLATDATYGFHSHQPSLECCSYSAIGFNNDPVDVVLDGTEQLDVFGFNSCSSEPEPISPFFTIWDTQAPSTAQMSYRQVKGVAPGFTNGSATGEVPVALGQLCPLEQLTPTVPINVCPSSTSIGSSTAESLQKIFPTYKTGVGTYVAVDVSPTTPSGVIVTETLSKGKSTCPTGFPNICVTSSGLTTSSLSIGIGGTTLDGTPLAPTPNVMWDEHALESTSSLLSSGQSCTVTCNQQYSCGGSAIGQYTITYNFAAGTINGTLVTNVAASVK